MHASKATTQHSTKQYINCTITVTNGAHKLLGSYIKLSQQQSQHLYHCYTWISAESCLAVKQFIQPHLLTLKNIADLADLLKQMWFPLTIEMYKLWHKGTTCG